MKKAIIYLLLCAAVGWGVWFFIEDARRGQTFRMVGRRSGELHSVIGAMLFASEGLDGDPPAENLAQTVRRIVERPNLVGWDMRAILDRKDTSSEIFINDDMNLWRWRSKDPMPWGDVVLAYVVIFRDSRGRSMARSLSSRYFTYSKYCNGCESLTIAESLRGSYYGKEADQRIAESKRRGMTYVPAISLLDGHDSDQPVENH